jgi:hypothetical protein
MGIPQIITIKGILKAPPEITIAPAKKTYSCSNWKSYPKIYTIFVHSKGSIPISKLINLQSLFILYFNHH